MIIFHEGLPRSGKSYEAVTRHLIGSLKQGRKVFAYVEGLNHDKIAECAEITPERCRELLFPLTREQVPTVYEHVEDNAFVILDEAQNFWPTGRQKLSPEMTQFITEHGHRGLDILIMGQDLRDVHALWRRRVAMKVVFSKMDALGAENRYNVRVFKAVTPENFERVSSDVGVYDPKYFGTYKSHVSETTNTLNYKDSRATIWNNKMVRLGIPGAFAAAAVGVWYIGTIFSGDTEIVKTASAKPAHVQAAPAPAPAPAPQPSRPALAIPTAPAPVAEPKAAPPADYIADLSRNARPRLAGWMETRDRVQGVVEWYAGSTRVERLTVSQLAILGYTVEHSDGVAVLKKDDREIVATSWPLEPVYRVSEERKREAGGDLPRDVGASQIATRYTM